jgi:hypothetical protein
LLLKALVGGAVKPKKRSVLKNFGGWRNCGMQRTGGKNEKGARKVVRFAPQLPEKTKKQLRKNFVDEVRRT